MSDPTIPSSAPLPAPPRDAGDLVRWANDFQRAFDNAYRLLAARSDFLLLDDTVANQPTADGTRRLFYATDTGVLYYDYNGTWVPINGYGYSLLPFFMRSDSHTVGQTLLWTDQPAALTEAFGTAEMRIRADLSSASQVRFGCRVETVGNAGAKLGVQYSDDGGSTWANFDGSANTAVGEPAVEIDSSGERVSSWQDAAAGAKADVWIRMVGDGGDGAVDPELRKAWLEVKHKATV